MAAAGCTNPNTTTIERRDQPTEQKPLHVAYFGKEGKTAMELLKENYTVVTKDYPGLGEFVESINGVKPDQNHFWSYYIDGKPAQVGASSYKTKNSDQIEWILEEIKK